MEKGEPPGGVQDLIPTEEATSVSKPIRISISFKHKESGTGRNHVLTKPLTEVLHTTAVLLIVTESGETIRKTIGVVMGPMSIPSNGDIQYSAVIATKHDTVTALTERLTKAIADLERLYKTKFTDLIIGPESFPQFYHSYDGYSTVESPHETPSRNNEPRESNGDSVSTEPTHV